MSLPEMWHKTVDCVLITYCQGADHYQELKNFSSPDFGHLRIPCSSIDANDMIHEHKKINDNRIATSSIRYYLFVSILLTLLLYQHSAQIINKI